MKGREKQIAALSAAQEQRKQDCLKQTENAIAKLVQKNEQLSFGAIAILAGVSVSYLYKYPEIKERIQQLQKQQIEGVNKPSKSQTASEKSKQIIINQLRDRIKTLEYEKKQLSLQNEKMTGQLYEMGRTQDLFEHLKAETLRLREENKQLRTDLEATRKQLTECQQSLITSNSKVTSLDQERDQQSTTDDISDELKSKFNEVKFRLYKT